MRRWNDGYVKKETEETEDDCIKGGVIEFVGNVEAKDKERVLSV